MRIRFRLGPFTFGRSGSRLSSWHGGTGFSIPLFNRNAHSFGKMKLGISNLMASLRSGGIKKLNLLIYLK